MGILEVQLSAARQDLPNLLTRVVRQGSPVRVTRRGGESAVMIADDQLERLLAGFPFPLPEGTTEPDGSFSYWLPDLELYANAPTQAEAQAQLTREVLDYSDDYLTQPSLLYAPNRQHHLPWVLRALLGSSAEKLQRQLFS